MVTTHNAVSNELIDLRDDAVVAERVRLDRCVELDGALQDAELHVQLLGGVVADEQLGDVHVHREVAGQEVLAEVLHVRHDLRSARRRQRRANPRRLADRFLTFGDAARVEAHPGKPGQALAERGVVAVVLGLALQVVHDVHAEHLGRRVPRRADELLLEALRQEDPVRAHVRLRALVLVRLQHGRAGRQTISVISSSESSVAGRLDVTEVQRDGTPQRLMRTVVRSSAIEFRSGATLSGKARRRRYRRGRRRARAPTSGHLVGSTSGMAPRVSAIRTASTQKNNGWRELGAKRADELIVALGVASSSVVPIYLSFLLKCASATIDSFD